MIVLQVLRLDTRVKANEAADSEAAEEDGEEEKADPSLHTFWTKRAILDVRLSFSLCYI